MKDLGYFTLEKDLSSTTEIFDKNLIGRLGKGISSKGPQIQEISKTIPERE